jgi:membrane protein DedA with SNARE-associated domain
MTTWLAIVLATFVSEDLTCITTGLLIRDGELGAAVGVSACLVGIVVGDFGLWLLGRYIGAPILRMPRVRARLPVHRLDQLGAWFDRQGFKAVLLSRFLPGTRLPVFVAAGLVGRRAGYFIFWATLAALLWTPMIVGAVAILGEVVLAPVHRYIAGGWIGLLLSAILLFLAVRFIVNVSSAIGRARFFASVSQLWRWEFWAPWIFYLPAIPWIIWLAIRHRGLSTITAANPGIPHGGIVGESKFDILRKLPREWVVPTDRIDARDLPERAASLRRIMDAHGIEFPLVLKPDVGERGAGVRLVYDMDAAERHLRETEYLVLVQAWHPGPYEAGVFYYRLPDEPAGRIFSITDKKFPQITGDGRSSVQSLIWNHPRYRMQARRFLARLHGKADRVLADGEMLPLAAAGNHCQGTMFLDGADLVTPQLTERIDQIARAFDGFYFGRFDVRYIDEDSFRAGRDFAIIELNGASSESTNLYDPSRSLVWAYRTLFRQWRILFETGAQNREMGHTTTPAWELLRLVRRYYKNRSVDTLAD